VRASWQIWRRPVLTAAEIEEWTEDFLMDATPTTIQDELHRLREINAEMLEALKKAVAEQNMLREETTWTKAARAAIAKAEGK